MSDRVCYKLKKNILSDIHLQTYLVLVAFLLGSISYMSSKRVDLLVLVILGLNATCDLVSTYMAMHRQNTHGNYSVLTLAEGVLTLIVYSMLTKDKRLRWILISVIPVLLSLGIYNLIWGQGLDNFNTHTFAPMGIMIMVASYLVLRESIGTVRFRAENISLWYAFACFLYFGIGAFNMSVTIWAQKNGIERSHAFLILNDILYGIFSLLLISGYIFKLKHKKHAF
jgi:hypothetical protein